MKTIKTKSQSNWDILILELEHISKRLSLISNDVDKLNSTAASTIITISALVKVLIDKNILTDSELNKAFNKISKDLKKQRKKEIDKIKFDSKKSFYDEILKSDIGANA